MLDLIRAALDALPPSEQRVASVVLNDAKKFVGLSIGQIADISGVSKPTVVRFCRSMGYNGLTEFKFKLGNQVTFGVPFVHPFVAAQDGTTAVLVKVLDSAVAGLMRYRNCASSSAFDNTVSAIQQAYSGGHAIDFYGVGHSGLVAQDAQQKLFRLGVESTVCSEAHLQTLRASLRKPGDLVIAISVSGRTRDLISAVDTARKHGANVVAMTASGTPLASMADVLLTLDHLEDCARYSPMTSRLLQLLVIDVMTTSLALKMSSNTLHERLLSVQACVESQRFSGHRQSQMSRATGNSL